MKRLLMFALALGIGLVVRREIPQLKRYVKMSRM